MSYVQRVLQPGEVVRHNASIHWIVYWPGALCLVAAGLVLLFGPRLWANHPTFWTWVASLITVIALFFLIREWFSWWTTEVAVTNLRVICKTGLIKRKTKEMNMDKIESVEVDQSILGRILDYGNVNIKGTGAGGEPLDVIAHPIELRNSITGVSHSHDVQSPQSTTPSR